MLHEELTFAGKKCTCIMQKCRDCFYTDLWCLWKPTCRRRSDSFRSTPLLPDRVWLAQHGCSGEDTLRACHRLQTALCLGFSKERKWPGLYVSQSVRTQPCGTARMEMVMLSISPTGSRTQSVWSAQQSRNCRNLDQSPRLWILRLLVCHTVLRLYQLCKCYYMDF